MTRPLYTIAEEIEQDWKRVNYAAAPYLRAMFRLEKIDEDYGYDSADSIVLYFLANSGTWRGDTARRIKAELKTLLSRKTK